MAMQVPRHIYAVRHCERIDEANEVWYYNSRFGRDNPPLSKRGMQQAEELKTE
jgi:broad specificity phosphatase PhoE